LAWWWICLAAWRRWVVAALRRAALTITRRSTRHDVERRGSTPYFVNEQMRNVRPYQEDEAKPI
jgi:hypothetical protein